jgi:2-polyprenyl-3-methyl-5-hydroxy-6-metoxy-1,4-benzoquinol methylase
MLCPFDKEQSSILYQSNNKDKKIDLKCTSEIHEKPTLYKCTKCNLIFSEYVHSKFEEEYSNVEDKKYIQQIPYKQKYFNLYLSKIRSFLNKDHKVLEIGSYYGILGNIIKPHVKEYTGLELSKHAAEYSNENFELNIANEPLEEFVKKNNKFDIIIMNDVIEHLDDPFKSLKLIEKSLKSNGILIFTTFNINSIIPKILKSKYHWIMPMHKFYFSNSTLKFFLKANNMNLFKIKTDTRLVSFEYLLEKFCVLAPKINFIFKFFLKIDFLKKMTIKINLLDLNIYFAKKIK